MAEEHSSVSEGLECSVSSTIDSVIIVDGYMPSGAVLINFMKPGCSSGCKREDCTAAQPPVQVYRWRESDECILTAEQNTSNSLLSFLQPS